MSSLHRVLNCLSFLHLLAYISVVSSPSAAENGFYAHLRSERSHPSNAFFSINWFGHGVFVLNSSTFKDFQAVLDHTRIIKYHTLKYVRIVKKNKMRVWYTYYLLHMWAGRTRSIRKAFTTRHQYPEGREHLRLTW